ncbi:MAG: SAV_6107 family HEPN domain-containing protein [Actinomycetes bacterium]
MPVVDTWTAPVPRVAEDLLAQARRSLAQAALSDEPPQRYAAAHLAALRAAAAVLAVRTHPATSSRGRPRNAWTLLARVAPEMGEWAAFWAAGATKRAAAEAGLARVVTTREADDLVREAEIFLALVESMLGLAHQPALAG